MFKFYQEWQNFVYKTHFVRILHFWSQKLALAFIASFCIFLYHRLPMGNFFFTIGCPWELLGALGARKCSLCPVDQFLSSSVVDILGQIYICWGCGELSLAL